MGAKIHLNGTSQEGTYIHTDTQTHGHCDCMTESAQWPNSVKKKICNSTKWGGSKKNSKLGWVSRATSRKLPTCDKTQTQIVSKPQNSNCDKTQLLTKLDLKLLQNSKTQIVTKVKLKL